MRVKVRTPLLYNYNNGRQTTEVSGSSVGECLDDLTRKFPEMKDLLFDKKGNLHDHLYIYVNKEDYYPEEMAKPVKNGDEIDIILIIGGG